MKRHTFLSTALGVAAVLLLGWQASAQDPFDIIYTHDGSPSRGTIIKITPTEITMDISTVEQTFAIDTIRGLTFADDPPDLRIARTLISEGRLEDAVESLQKVKVAEIKRAAVKQDYDYYTALTASKLALQGSGNLNTAARAMLTFEQNNKDSYHYFDAVEMVGDLAMALNNPKTALTYYEKLGAAPWPEYKLRAEVRGGDALRAGGDYAGATAKYQRVIGATVTTPEAEMLRTAATIGRAVCMANTNQFEQAIKDIEDFISKNDPDKPSMQPLFAQAYNAQGACYQSAKKPKDALLAYLHTDMLFYQNPETHAEALYNLVKLWEQENNSQEAIRARDKLKEYYPGSVWAKKLQ